jgi:hypothetical protein
MRTMNGSQWGSNPWFHNFGPRSTTVRMKGGSE